MTKYDFTNLCWDQMDLLPIPERIYNKFIRLELKFGSLAKGKLYDELKNLSEFEREIIGI